VVAAGTPVVRLAVDGPRDVVVAVPEHRADHVRVGMKASVRLWASDQTYSATVREVAASADPVTRTFQVKLAIPPASDAGGAAAALGSTAYVRFDAVPAVGAAAPVLIKLPTSALWQQGQGSAVWLFDAGTGTVQSRPVVVATADGNEAVIASGLVGGEQVVVAGVHVLAEGQNVTLFQEKNEQKVPSALTNQQKLAIDVVVKP
jgi:RND family efflux transporter MFP subunit